MAQATNYRKAITDAPNLRGNNERTCGNCNFYRWLPQPDVATAEGEAVFVPPRGICRKFEFEPQANYVCDDWQHWQPESEPESETEPASEMTAAQMDDEKTLVMFGGSVKALGNGRVGGYLVRFTPRGDYDLENERFDAQTDYGDAVKSDAYYQHGLDDTLGKRVLGKADLRRDEAGIWAEAQLALRDEYEKMIYALAEQNKLGWSSGTASHLVERVPEGKGFYIKRWILGLDASLTPTPAEPRNGVVSLKTLQRAAADNGNAPGDAASVERAVTTETESAAQTIKQGDDSAQARQESEEMDEQTKAKIDALEAQLKKFEGILEAQTPSKAGYVTPATKKVTERGFKNDDVKSFEFWLRTGDDVAARGALKEAGNDFNAYKTALAEGTGANGGYVVPTPYYDQIIAKRDEIAIPMLMGAKPIQTALSSIGIPTENAKQSNFAIVSEAGAVNESEPTFSQVLVTVYAWRRLLKVSWELLQDQTANLDEYLSNSIGRAAGLTINDMCLVGTGSGQPQGAVVGATLGVTAAGAAAITAAEMISLIYKLPAGYRDRAALVMATAVEGYVRGLTSNFLAFQRTPAGEANPQQPFGGGGIMGYPTFNSASMAALATSNKTVLFGNWDYYAFVERAELVVQRNEYLYMANGQVGIFANWRWGGAVLQAEAFQYLQQA